MVRYKDNLHLFFPVGAKLNLINVEDLFDRMNKMGDEPIGGGGGGSAAMLEIAQVRFDLSQYTLVRDFLST